MAAETEDLRRRVGELGRQVSQLRSENYELRACLVAVAALTGEFDHRSVDLQDGPPADVVEVWIDGDHGGHAFGDR